MSDIEKRLDEHDKKLKQLISTVNSVANRQFLICDFKEEKIKEINDLKGNVRFIQKMLEREKMSSQKSGLLIVTWLLASIALIVLSVALAYIDSWKIEFIELASSWLTAGFLLFGGGYAAYRAHRSNHTLGYILAAAWALIATCYGGYVFIDFGSLYPRVAAIGFNIATIAQTLGLLAVIYYFGRYER